MATKSSSSGLGRSFSRARAEEGSSVTWIRNVQIPPIVKKRVYIILRVDSKKTKKPENMTRKYATKLTYDASLRS